LGRITRRRKYIHSGVFVDGVRKVSMAFGFKSIGHFFASVAHDVKTVATFISSHQAQIDTTLQVGAQVISTADPALAPLASIIERAAEAALGEVLAAVSATDAAMTDKGLSITLDSAAVADFKSLLAQIEAAKPGATVVPAGLVPAVPAK
jgi:hypothetical protein